MIGKLKGVIDAYGQDWAIVDVAGVGYQVYCSTRTTPSTARGRRGRYVVDRNLFA